MIINHTWRFIFVHIPKNAGTSIAHYLSPLSTYRDQEIGATELGVAVAPHFRKRFGLAKHSTMAEIAAVVGPDALEQYLTFCVVRDPVERVRSVFSFLQHWDRWQRRSPFASLAKDFRSHDVNQFVRSAFFQGPGPDRLLNPQTSWIVDPRTDRLMIDRVLRLETLDDDLARVLGDLGAPREMLDSRGLGTLNATGSNSGPALDEESLRIIHERYARDFELLGYEPAAATLDAGR
jgi:hypothetical protein